MSAAGGILRKPRARRPLTLSRSVVLKGAELYEGNFVDKFDTGWHLHDGWQIVAVTHGERRYEFQSRTLVARPGHLVLLPPKLIHRAQCAKEEPTSFRIATLPALGFHGLADAVPAEASDSKLFDRFLSTYLSLQAGDSREDKAVLLTHLETVLYATIPTCPDGELRAPAFVIETQQYLLEFLHRVPSLAALSARARVSPFHLAHAFKKFVGLSPLAFHARARLLKARTLLSEGNRQIDVALSLGFADQSHFGRHFKSVYAMTPREYRQSVTSASASTARSF